MKKLLTLLLLSPLMSGDEKAKPSIYLICDEDMITVEVTIDYENKQICLGECMKEGSGEYDKNFRDTDTKIYAELHNPNSMFKKYFYEVNKITGNTTSGVVEHYSDTSFHFGHECRKIEPVIK